LAPSSWPPPADIYKFTLGPHCRRFPSSCLPQPHQIYGAWKGWGETKALSCGSLLYFAASRAEQRRCTCENHANKGSTTQPLRSAAWLALKTATASGSREARGKQSQLMLCAVLPRLFGWGVFRKTDSCSWSLKGTAFEERHVLLKQRYEIKFSNCNFLPAEAVASTRAVTLI